MTSTQNNTKFIFAAAFAVCAAPAFAQSDAASGDVAAGEEAFGQCVTCHVVETPEGETLAGRNAKTGPNLYGVINQQAGLVEGFRYGKDLVKAGEDGLVWNEENFVAYVKDPTSFLREFTDNKRARSKMANKVRKDEDAVNLYAYMLSLQPEAATN
ncbi:c-type cytochrome [Oceaniglobus ichthyenteri]|uniref:c-type cytochrome n=1 Tax=Oceaniglobus ichthyenteri TaxID=2136177 RepID=UPI000D3B6782|nr:cytochrome C [Oceaniglobus ichthyenteri]